MDQGQVGDIHLSVQVQVAASGAAPQGGQHLVQVRLGNLPVPGEIPKGKTAAVPADQKVGGAGIHRHLRGGEAGKAFSSQAHLVFLVHGQAGKAHQQETHLVVPPQGSVLGVAQGENQPGGVLTAGKGLLPLAAPQGKLLGAGFIPGEGQGEGVALQSGGGVPVIGADHHLQLSPGESASVRPVGGDQSGGQDEHRC